MAQMTDKGPHGWIVRISSKFPDRVYYFNTFTGSSTWECPELVPQKLSDINEASSSEPLYKSFSEPLHKSFSENKTPVGQRKYKNHTPEGFPPHQKFPNISNKRSLEICTPDIHSPKKNPTCNKPDVPYQNPAKKRQLDTDGPSTSKSSKIPTAIVTPVIVGQDRNASSTPGTSQATKNKNKNKKKSKAKLKNNLAVPLKEPVKNGKQITTQTLPVKGCKQPTKQTSSVQRVVQPTVPKGAKQPLLPTPQTVNNNKSLKASSPVKRELVKDKKPPLLPTPSTYTRYEIASNEKSARTLNFFKDSFNATSSSEPDIDTSWEDVEMLDVSDDLTNIDEAVPSNNANELDSFFLVIDTNMLIHDLAHIKEIKETPLQGCGPPHFFIPWIVFQELDGLKSNNDKAGKLAQNAVRYLHNILKSKHPRFHGQSGEDAHNCKRDYHDSNDDKIIDLCLSLRKKTVPEKIILLTNDKNLANKAMTYEIIVHDWPSFLKSIIPDIPIQATTSNKDKAEKKGSIPAIISKEKSKLVNERNRYEKEIDFLMAEARQLLKDNLDMFLVEEMQKAYGDTWEHFQIDRRLLREILAAYIKYWSTVFSLIFTKKLKKNFEHLHQKAASDEGFNGNYEECLIILHAIEDIFCAIVNLRPHMSFLISRIQSLLENCSQIFSNYNNVDSSISNVDDALKVSVEDYVLGILNSNWTVINELCGMIMDFFKIQHSFEYAVPEMIPPESEYRRVVSDLYPSLIQLKQLMKKVIEHVQKSTPSQVTFKKFVKALSDLVPSLKIKYVMPDLTHFTGKAMEQFCRKPENRQRIEMGYSQLETFCNKLNEAIQAMIQVKKIAQV